MKKFCAPIVAAAVMLCLYYTVRTYGNIFYMSYALNSAKKSAIVNTVLRCLYRITDMSGKMTDI